LFPKGQKYPEKPLEVFSDPEEETLSPEERQMRKVLKNEREARERWKQIDEILASKGKPPQEIIGEKRI
jgi:hypothetical protein